MKAFTQKELIDLYEELDNKDCDTSDEKFEEAIKERGGVDVVVFFSGGVGDELGETFGLDNLLEMLKKHEFTILDDPRYDYEDTEDQGWIIFPPEKSDHLVNKVTFEEGQR